MDLRAKRSTSAEPAEVTLEITPRERVEVIDVHKRLQDKTDALEGFEKATYCSHHTTAGYFEQVLARRFEDTASMESYVEAFQTLFPPEADYRHDQMELRSELSEEQRLVEPRNADSHLTFIGAGLQSCVTYDNSPDQPVYLVELDGLNGNTARRRRTSIIGHNRTTKVHETEIVVPMSVHPMDSISLRDPDYDLYGIIEEKLHQYGVVKGRVVIRLHPGEQNAGLTVNEYETLLMRQDLVDVLRDPMRFMAEKGYNMLRDPRAIPGKARDYAKYDLVRIVNNVIDKFGLGESLVERVIDKFLSVPAARFLRMKRSLQLMVSDSAPNPDGSARSYGGIVTGTYQSPILVQWRKSDSQSRRLVLTIEHFE